MSKLQIVMKAKKNNVPFFIVVCQAILAGLTAHTSLYPALPVLLTLLASQLQSLIVAQQQVKLRVPGAAANRDTLRDELFTSVESIRTYVQGLCDASPEQALTLAQGAGLKIAASRVYAKPILGATQGAQPGVVSLAANAKLLGAGAKGYRLYNWAYSLDGKTWVAAPSTPFARTTLAGLTPLTTYQFRVSLTTKAGQGEWSQALSFVVH